MHPNQLDITLLKSLLEQSQQAPAEVAQRLQWFIHFAECGSVSETCRVFGIARTTFYRWMKRLDLQDLRSLQDSTWVMPVQKVTSTPTVHAPVAVSPTLAKVFCENAAEPCPLCRLKSFNWTSFRSAAFITSILFNLALASLIVFTAMLEGQSTNAAPSPVTLLPGFEHTTETEQSLLPLVDSEQQAVRDSGAETSFTDDYLLPAVHSLLGIEIANAATGIYRPINYQGKLTNSGGVAIANGTYDLRFKIYSAASGGNPIWSETWSTATQKVTATGGLFSIALGTHVAMTGSVNFNSDSLFLQVEFDPGADGTFEEVFSPRRRFASVPYAHNANSVDGLDSTQFIRSDISYTSSGTITVSPRDAAKTGIDILSTAGTANVAALKISTQGANHIVFGTGAANYDTNLYRASANLLKTDDSFTAVGTISGTTLVVSGNASISGALVVRKGISGATLEVLGTASGADLYATRSITGTNIYAATTFGGAGLADCDTAGTSKLLWDVATKRFSCGTDQTGGSAGTTSFSGAVLRLGDARYVKKQGDTMTGALVIDLTSGFLGLRIIETASGDTIHAEKMLSSSGQLVLAGSGLLKAGTLNTKPLTVRGAASQAANLTEWQSNLGAGLLAVTGAGDLQQLVNGTWNIRDFSGTPFFSRTNAGTSTFGGSVGSSFIFGTILGGPASVLSINPAINYSSAVGYTALAINVTENSVPTGMRYLANFKLGTTSKFAITATGAVGIGTEQPGSRLSVSGSAIIGNNLGTAAADSNITLEVLGTASGTNLYATKSVSGQNIFATRSISGTHLYTATTFAGAGLADCDTAGTSKLLWDAATKRFSCGTDQTGGSAGTASFSGAVLRLGDARYVKKSGDTMTGALTINVTGGNDATLGLNVLNTISGAIVRASKQLTSSGTLVTESGATFDGGTLFVDAVNNRVGIGSTNLLNYGLHVATTSRFDSTMAVAGLMEFVTGGAQMQFDAASGIRYLGDLTFSDPNATATLILSTGKVGVGTTANNTALEVLGTASGTDIYATRNISGSNLFAARSISGTYLYAATTFGGAGLASCSNSTTSKLLYNSATKQFSCGTDQTGGSAGTASFSGAVLRLGDARYVKKQGDTMTGALVIDLTSGFLGLRIIETASGNIIHAEKDLTSSGTLKVVNTARFSSGASFDTNTLTIDANANRVGIGTTTPKASLDVVGTISGKTLVVSGNASITGSLVVRKGISGATLEVLGTASGMDLFATRSVTGTHLYAATTFAGAGLADCDTAGTSKLLWDSATKRFSCGTDQTGGPSVNSGGVLQLGDARYVRKAGDTMTGALTIDLTSGYLGLKIIETASGNIIHAEKDLTSSGTLKIVNTARFSSGAFFDTNTLSIDANANRVGIGTTAPKATLDIVGTLSGRNLVISNHAAFSGAVVLGSASTDVVTFKSVISGSLIPAITNTYSLGSDTLRWKNFFLSGAINIGVSGDSAQIQYDTVGDRIKFDADSDGNIDFRMADIGSFDILEASSNAPTASNYARIFARPSTSGGNDSDTTYLVNAEDASGVATNSAQGRTNTNSHGGSCISNSAAQAKFGTNSISLNCAGYQYYRFSSTNDDYYTTGDFTVDTWVYEGANTSVNRFLIGMTAINDHQWSLQLTSGNKLQGNWKTSTGMTISITDTVDFPTGQWVHIAFERSGNTFRVYKNGTAIGSIGSSAALKTLSSRYLMLGNRYPYNFAGDQNFTGYMDEIRISKVARYSGNFTAPVAAYAGDTGGLFVRLSNGRLINLTGSGSSSGGGGGDSVWTVNNDNSIYYNIGQVGVGTTTPLGQMEVQQDDLFGSGALLVDQNVATGTGIYVDSSATGAPGIAISMPGNATSANPHLLFGYDNIFDTNLYRPLVNTLRTDGSLQVGGALTVTGVTTLNGNTIIGSDSSDTVTFNALVNSNITPSADVTYDLGTSSLRWRDLYLGGSSMHIGTDGNEGTIGYDTSANYLTFNPDAAGNPEVVMLDNGSVGIGTLAPKATLDVFGTISGATLTISGDGSFSGSLVVAKGISGATLEVLGTASGQNLFATRSITGTNIYAATTFGGAGLASCSNSTTSKLLYNSATKQFSCGTDNTGGSAGTASFSGAVLRLGDARYVRKAGDTMTGALTIDLTSGSLGLRIIETASGNIIHAEKTLTSSGTIVAVGSITTRNTLSGKTLVVSGNASVTGSLVVSKNISGATLEILGTASGQNLFATRSISGTHLYAATTFGGAGLASCSNATTSKLLYNSATKQFSCGTDQNSIEVGTSSFSGATLRLADARYVRKAGDTMTGALTIDLTSGFLGLKVIETASGNIIHAEKTLTSSGIILAVGSITTRNTFSGKTLVVSGNASVTGSLVVNRSISGATLEILGTASGQNLFATRSISGTHLYAATTFGGAGLASCSNGTTSKLLYNSATKQFSCGTDQTGGTGVAGTTSFSGSVLILGDARYVRKAGDTMTGALTIDLTSGYLGLKIIETASGAFIHAEKGLSSSGTLVVNGAAKLKTTLTVLGTITGSVVHAERTLTSSGSLTWEGAASGSTLYVATSINGAGLADCDTAGTSKLLWDSSTGRFSCGTDQTGGIGTSSFSGGVLRLADARYVKKSGDTMTGALAIYKNSGTSTGNTFIVDSRGLVYDASNKRVGIGTNAPEQLLHLARPNGGDAAIYFQERTAGSTSNLSAGPNSPSSTATDSAIGSYDWTNPGNVTASDDTRATVAYSVSSGQSYYLKATNFGFSIPSDATVLGVVVEWEKSVGNVTGGNINDAASRIIKGGTIGATDKSNGTNWPDAVSEAYTSYGSSSDLWGETWAYSDINDSGFGAAIAANCGGSCTLDAQLDHARITVYYSQPTGAHAYDWTIGADDSDSGKFKISNSGALGTRDFMTIDTSGNMLVNTGDVNVANGSLTVQNRVNFGGTTYYINGISYLLTTNVTTPTYTFASDANSGLYGLGNDVIGLSTGGVDRFRILSNGNIGIGAVSAPGSRLSVSGSVLIGRNIGSAQAQTGVLLEVLGTASGTNFYATKSVSGADLFATRSISGTHLYAASTFGGAGLGSCSNATTSKLLYNSATKQFSCGTDQAGSSTPEVGTSSFSGATLRLGDARYVNKQGDTMTGALTINLSAGTIGLNVLSAMSGNTLIVSKGAFFAGSGVSITSTGQTVFNEQSRNVDFRIESDGDANAFFVDASTNFIGIGKNNPKAKLDVQGTASGSALTVSGLANCNTNNTVKADAQGNLFCATDEGGGGSSSKWTDAGVITYLTATADDLAVGGSDALAPLYFNTAGKRLEVTNISGGTIRAQDSITSSGTLLTESGATFDAGTLYVDASGNRVGIGTTTPKATLDVIGTISGRTLVISGNGSFSGSLVVNRAISGATLEILGTASGQNLFATRSISGTHLYAASTFGGAGLASCSNATTSKLLYNSATKQFSCGTDQTGGSAGTASFSGAVLRLGDARYVRKAGDTMTGALTIDLTSGYLGLKIIETASGNIIHAEKDLTSSGTLKVVNTARFSSGASFDTNTLTVNANANRVGIGTATPKASLDVVGTISGKTLVVSGNASVTGSLVVNRSISGATLEILGTASGQNLFATRSISGTHLYAATTFAGAGLADCDTAGTSKLLWDSATKRFSCGTDQTGSSAGTASFSGAVLRLGDARYVKKQGDTMTGALVIDMTSGNGNTLGLRIINTGSGRHLHAEQTLTSSGTLAVEGNATIQSHLYVPDGSAGNPTIAFINDTDTGFYRDPSSIILALSNGSPVWHAGAGEFFIYSKMIFSAGNSIGQQGTNYNPDNIYLDNYLSGSTLFASTMISTSGSLVVKKNISGATLEILGTASGQNLFATRSISGSHLYSATTFGGAGLVDCDTAGTSKLLWDAATKQFSCGTDQTGGGASAPEVGTNSYSGATLRLGDARYVKKQGDTMTGALVIDLTSGFLGLRIIETASGNIIHAEKTLTSSGTILAVGSIATRNTLSGKTLVVSGNASVTGSLVVNKNISGAALEILGTASGLNLFATRSISGTHLYAATTFGGAGLTSCSNATTSKLLYNSATKQFSCGTDQTGGGGSAPEVGTSSFSGATLRLGDARYVKKQGDTMTGALVIDMTSGNGNTLGLRIINTASGRHLHAEQRLTSSGALIWEGAGSGRSLDLSGGNITFSLSGQTVFNALNRNVDFSIRSQTNNSAFFLDASTSRVGIGTNTLESAFEVVGSISGTTLIATGTGSKPLFFASAPWNSVGIGTNTPGQKLTVSGGSILNVAGGNVRTLSGVNIGAQFNDAVIVGRYAYIGQQGARFRIVDISNPLSPKIVSTLGMETNISSIVVSGNYAYLGMFTSTSRALIVVDISNPSAPVQIASLDVGGMSETRSLFIAGKHLFVGKASGFSTEEFFVVDINNPYAPKIISSMDLGSSVGINSVVVQGKYAYLGVEDDFSANELRVIDISSPNNLIDKGGVSLSTAVKSISIAGRYAYVGLASVSGNDFRIFDISNPASISTVGGLDLTTDVLSVDVAGRYAYLGLTSVSGNDFRVVDVSNVALPAIVGGADISTSARKVIAAGKFLYVGLPDVSGADFTIYDINGIDAPSASIGTLGVDVLYVGRNASVANTLTVLNSINVGVGGIKSDGMLSITVGSGSTVSGMTGAIIVNRGMSGTVLALDSWRGNGTGSQKIVPHLLFGYRGTFDTMLYRAGTGVLANSGTMLLRGGTGRTLLKMETGMTSSADANLMEVFSNVTTGFGDPNHNLILRMDAAGSMYTDGSFSGGGADYAERFLASTPNLKPGQAVCLDPLKSNTVKLCDRSGDSNVMGIVSTKPAFVGDKYRGVTGDTKSDATSTIVGLIGQLPAKAIVEDGQAITVGDALATAAKPGFVRKAKAGESTVGVALSPLPSGEGSIDVLITRRNQSDLVEKIENEVTQSIAEMHIEDDVLQMVQTAMNGANINATVASAVQAQVQSLNLAAEINAILNQRLADGTLNIGSNGSLPADILAALQTNSGSLSLQSAIASRLGLSRSGTSALTVGSDLLVSGALTVQHDVLIGGTLHAAAMSGPIRFDGPILPGTDFALGSMRFTGSTVQIGTITDAAALEVVGNVTIAGLTTFLGDVEVQGELIVSNNQAGFAIIPSRSKAVTVLFGTGFISTPIINATPNSRVGSEWWVDSQSQTGFVIRSEKPVAQDIRFSWTALGVRDAYTASGQAGAVPAIPFHVDAEGRPYSVADNVWNACIRDPNSLDACNGYHQGSMWFAHPDIMQANQEVLSFTYDAASGPSSLVIPASYETVVVEQVTSSSSSAQTSSTSSSASSESASSVASSESSSAMNSSESSSAVASSESASSVASSESSSAVSSSASSEASVSSSADSSASSEQP